MSTFARATLAGADRAVRCAIVDVSAGGALLTLAAAPPFPPLTLTFELGGEEITLPAVVRRTEPGGVVAVAFPTHSEPLFRLIAAEQRRALAQRRSNVIDRRLSWRGGEPDDRERPA